MVSTHGPAALRRQLGAELRRMRERARRTAADVAAELGWSESKLSRMETAKSGVRQTDLDRLLDLYDSVDPARREQLHEMLRQARQRAWWESYVISDAYRTYVGLEAEAESIWNFQPQLITGLLQTAEYARALSRATISAGTVGHDAADQFVAVRMTRQAILGRENPPELRAVIEEAALRRNVGGPNVMHRQMLRLLELSGAPAVSLRVARLQSRLHACQWGSFILLNYFGGDEQETVVFAEGMTGGLLRSRPEEVAIYRAAFEDVWAAALDATETSAFLTELANEYAGT